MAAVDIYTIRYCPYCQDAKDLLSRKGVSFHEIDASGNRDVRKQMIERAGGRSTYPQIFIGAVTGAPGDGDTALPLDLARARTAARRVQLERGQQRDDEPEHAA